MSQLTCKARASQVDSLTASCRSAFRWPLSLVSDSHRFEVIYRFRLRVGSLMELNEGNPIGFPKKVFTIAGF